MGLIIIIFACVYTGIETNKFDQGFSRGEVNLPAKEIGLNQEGHPVHTDIDLIDIPSGYSLQYYPRVFEIDGYEEFDLPEGATVLMVAAPAIEDQILITMPESSGGKVRVTTPDVLESVPVIMWVK